MTKIDLHSNSSSVNIEYNGLELERLYMQWLKGRADTRRVMRHLKTVRLYWESKHPRTPDSGLHNLILLYKTAHCVKHQCR